MTQLALRLMSNSSRWTPASTSPVSEVRRIVAKVSVEFLQEDLLSREQERPPAVRWTIFRKLSPDKSWILSDRRKSGSRTVSTVLRDETGNGVSGGWTKYSVAPG